MLNEDKFEIYLGNWKFLFLCIYALGGKNKDESFPDVGGQGQKSSCFQLLEKQESLFWQSLSTYNLNSMIQGV